MPGCGPLVAQNPVVGGIGTAGAGALGRVTFVSCRVVSCRVVSCRVVSCRVVSCRVVCLASAGRFPKANFTRRGEIGILLSCLAHAVLSWFLPRLSD